ncbi:hypothetical protein DMENIID0001_157540 [Sergentomyia squamirostris]
MKNRLENPNSLYYPSTITGGYFHQSASSSQCWPGMAVVDSGQFGPAASSQPPAPGAHQKISWNLPQNTQSATTLYPGRSYDHYECLGNQVSSITQAGVTYSDLSRQPPKRYLPLSGVF